MSARWNRSHAAVHLPGPTSRFQRWHAKPARMRAFGALLYLFLAGPASVHAQEQPPASSSAPIATDRPSFTNSSITVPAGDFQAENGFLDTTSEGQNVADAPETLIRVGVASRAEIRFYVPDYYYNASTGTGLGFGDFAFGAKLKLGPTPGGFDVSATVFLSCPTGAAARTSGGYDPGLQVAWSRGLTSKWTAAGMLSLYGPTEGTSRNLTGEATFLIDRQLSNRWDAFAEYLGDFRERGGTRQIVHLGSSLKITNQQQLDFQFGVGLTPAAPDHFVGIGYSFRFQAIRHRE